jgi:purine-nucleoside phosphorylase
MPDIATQTKSAVKVLRQRSKLRPALAMILGSGFQSALERVELAEEIPFRAIPGFPPVGVQGHLGKVVIGILGGAPVMLLSGRAHYYEGHAMEVVTFPTRVMAAFGIRHLLLTNAAGGINRHFRVGDLMRLTDHINLMGANPLRGAPLPGCERFVDLTQVYDTKLASLLEKAAKLSRIPLRRGVYLAVSGPSYETPAEIRAFSRLGADAVGMSTVPEAIVARQCGLAVAGLSCITNLAANLGGKKLDHQDVLAESQRVKARTLLLLEIFAKLHAEEN